MASSLWQPIETAPRDDIEILVWQPGDGAFVAFWYARGKRYQWTTHNMGGDEILEATHWMPLPQPPDMGDNK
jgi:hypothetical protein